MISRTAFFLRLASVFSPALIMIGCATSINVADKTIENADNSFPRSMELSLKRLNALEEAYETAATERGKVRNAARTVGILSTVAAVVNSAAGGADGASVATGLIGGSALATSDIIAPAGRPQILMDGIAALICAREAVQPIMSVSSADDTRMPDLRLALSEDLDELDAELGSVNNLVSGFSTELISVYQSTDLPARIASLKEESQKGHLAVDRADAARRDLDIAGDRLWTTTEKIENTINRRLENLDRSLDPLIEVLNARILASAGSITGKPDLFKSGESTDESHAYPAELLEIDDKVRHAESLARTTNKSTRNLSATIDLIKVDPVLVNLAACTAKAVGGTGDVVSVVIKPEIIQLGDAEKLTADFDVDGGNAPYAADWIGDEPEGLTLTARDTGQGTFRVTADKPDDANAGDYQIIIRDEDRRIAIVTGKVAGKPSATASSAVPAQPARRVHADKPYCFLIEGAAGAEAAVWNLQNEFCSSIPDDIFNAAFTELDRRLTDGFLVDGVWGETTEAVAIAFYCTTTPEGEECQKPVGREEIEKAVCKTLGASAACPAVEEPSPPDDEQSKAATIPCEELPEDQPENSSASDTVKDYQRQLCKIATPEQLTLARQIRQDTSTAPLVIDGMWNDLTAALTETILKEHHEGDEADFKKPESTEAAIERMQPIITAAVQSKPEDEGEAGDENEEENVEEDEDGAEVEDGGGDENEDEGQGEVEEESDDEDEDEEEDESEGDAE